ncbi:transcription termination factor Rho [Schaalia sp. lx-260]|uniref:transcription termination factor Rho n=1 Tax=Schaalia sp. lx-260 TaxID=2899082 RepID=UPI001E3627F7|nr:transcription termination factor Rho [Schaalia sp. lx-260]MCD4549656.1 transcription termination factor Rho [Schaalia sp. lx-260]
MSNDTSAAVTGKDLQALKLSELKALASRMGLKGVSTLRKGELVAALAAAQETRAPSEKPVARRPRRAVSMPEAEPVLDLPQVEEKTGSEQSVRKGRRRRVVSTESAEPAHITLDLPARVSHEDDGGEQLPELEEKTQRSLDSIEFPEGDDTENRGRRRGRDRRRGRERTDRTERRDNRDRTDRRERPRDNMEFQLREDDVLAPIAGILDIQENHAFVRTSGYLPGPNDVYVTLGNVRRWGLRAGDAVVGAVRQPREGERQRQKYNALVRVDAVNGMTTEEAAARREFGKLTPLYPNEQLRMETSAKAFTPRVIDLVAPIGKGQRGLIVSPPKAGKTMVIQQIAKAIEVNNPEVHLMVVLVDERPEEVTDMRSIVKGEVIASTFDRPAADHTIVAELAIERAKRLVELGQDVVVLLDSLTRLSRAYNLAAPASGRILSGGVDASALYPPKKFFGAARNLKEGGSLTIIASALVETGSKMDEVIFEEFKGTGNMELRLSRQLADRRIFPAIDVNASGTRREEVLFRPEELRIMWKLRRVLGTLDQQSALEIILEKLKETQSNAEFLMLVQKTTPTVD